MKLSDLLSKLKNQAGVTEERRHLADGQTVIILTGRLPAFPFGDRAHAWYTLVLEPGQDEVSPDEVEAILRRFWQAQLDFFGEADEKAFRKGHHYLTLVNDLARGRVLYVAQDRKQSSLDGFWATLTPEQIGAVEAVAMDMWNPYIASVREHLPEADGKIVFDKFHIAQHLGGAVDKVRRKENKILRAAGDDTLVGTRYDWLRHPARMEPKDRRAFAALRDSGLKTARAWALKETMMAFFDYRYERPARKHFRWWHNWAVRSRLQPMIAVGRMLKRRFANIVTYLRHRITNATSESLNAKIQWVKYTARGFRNKQNSSR